MAIRWWIIILLMGIPACSQVRREEPATPLKHFALDSMEGVRASAGVTLDSAVSSDGHGSLRVDAAEPLVVPLFEVTDVSIENAVLIYQANLQSEALEGQ